MGVSEFPILDAEGSVIPVGTYMLYDSKGNKVLVHDLALDLNNGRWKFLISKECDYETVHADELYIENPVQKDSWEKLYADLKRVEDFDEWDNLDGTDAPTCAYIGIDKKNGCKGCELFKSKNCTVAMCSSILYRIRNLRGETHAR